MDEQGKRRLGVLIRNLALGDTSALGDISLLMEKVLKAVGNSYYKHKVDIEDAISSLYVRLYYVAEKFQYDKNPYSWIIKIYENIIKSDLRAKKLEREHLQKNYFIVRDAVDEQYIENHLLIRGILDKVSKEEAYILIYYYWCKCSIREIAEILKKSKSTVERKLKKLDGSGKKFVKILTFF